MNFSNHFAIFVNTSRSTTFLTVHCRCSHSCILLLTAESSSSSLALELRSRCVFSLSLSLVTAISHRFWTGGGGDCWTLADMFHQYNFTNVYICICPSQVAKLELRDRHARGIWWGSRCIWCAANACDSCRLQPRRCTGLYYLAINSVQATASPLGKICAISPHV